MVEKNEGQTGPVRKFMIEQVFTDKCSFEAPKPLYRLEKEWKPNANLDLDVKTTSLKDSIYEVTLIISVSVSIDGEKVFDTSVEQVGAFRIEGYENNELNQLLNSFCPTILYPYSRQVIADMVGRANFPPLHLSPVDFEGRYQSMLAQSSDAK